MSTPANAEAIEAWNTVLFDKFVRFRHIVIGGFTGLGHAVLESHPIAEGARVLDVGCGFGDTTIDLARRVGSKGSAVGVDAAPRFIESARRDGEVAGVSNARFVVADVEADDLGGPYDRVFSRFGTMFFASPVAAMRNLRKSLVPGGLLTMAVWRRKDENPFFYECEQRVLSLVTHHEKGDQVTCGPGPFSMSSPDVVSAQLKAAGFHKITFERVDLGLSLGDSVEAAIDFCTSLGPAGEVIRLAGAEAEAKKPQIMAALHDLLSGYLVEGKVIGHSSVWIVSARA